MPTVTAPGSYRDDTEPLTMDEVKKEAKSVIEKVIKDVGKTSATKQLILGCGAGWLTGYLMMKVGKIAAVALGGGIILLQIANHNGYIKVDWDKLTKKADQIADEVEVSSSSKGPKFLSKDTLQDKVKNFAQKNTYMAAGYAGGFLIGIASS